MSRSCQLLKINCLPDLKTWAFMPLDSWVEDGVWGMRCVFGIKREKEVQLWSRWSPDECGLVVRTGPILHHLLKLLCFLFVQGARFHQSHGCHWCRSSEVRTLSVGSLIWNLATESGEPLWLDQEREDSGSSHILQRYEPFL